MSHNTPMTVGDLKALLSALPDYAWVCLQDGPAVNLEKELGGSEPFVVLTGSRRCPHGAFDGEPCGACEDVRRVMGTADEVNARHED